MRISLRALALSQLVPAARLLMAAVVLGFAAVWGLVSASDPWVATQVVTCAAFTAAAVFSAEVSMRLAWPRTRRDRLSRDLLSVWILPIAWLLPPAYVVTMVVVVRVYVQLRVARLQTMKLVYSTAALALSYAGSSVILRLVLGRSLAATFDSSDFGVGPRTAAALLLAGLAWWAINAILIGGIVGLTAGSTPLRAYYLDVEGVVVDAVAVCLGILAASLWIQSPVAATLLVPPVLLLQHQLFSGLRRAVRTDLLTEAANPQFWRETAAREIDRATASGTNLALLMVDIDHFKNVNDQHGHLAGDDVLAAVAHTISKTLRPGDLVGRLGGEEFGAILAGLNLLDAEGAAERLRAQVGEIRVRSDRGEWIEVTVSVGVAELSVTGGGLHEVLGAADMALYAAKAAGRNRVRVAGGRVGHAIDLRSGSEIDLGAGLT
ncbi:MAG: diguanylate cyclase [Acidothermaceae bacterium]